MDVSDPRRVLAVSLTQSSTLLSRVISDLIATSSPSPPQSAPKSSTPETAAQSQDQESIAGSTHILPLTTPYYKASIPIWLDLIAPPVSEWADGFLSEEAKEVLGSLGGIIVVFDVVEGRKEATKLVEGVGRVVKDGLGGWEWDGLGLAVGVSGLNGTEKNGSDGKEAQESVGLSEDGEELDYWEDVCGEACLEFVHVKFGQRTTGEGKKNEFGEKTGLARVKEALEANDWAAGPDTAALGLDEDDNDEEQDVDASGNDDLDFNIKTLGLTSDMDDFGDLQQAILPPASFSGADTDLDDASIQQVEAAMRKLQAVRELGEGMPEDQRRRMAARAVGEVMRQL